MKKTYIIPTAKIHQLHAPSLLAGSNEIQVFGSSLAEEDSEGLSKGSLFHFVGEIGDEEE